MIKYLVSNYNSAKRPNLNCKGWDSIVKEINSSSPWHSAILFTKLNLQFYFHTLYVNNQVWTFRACEIADLQIFKCDFKTTLNPLCKSLSLFLKPRGGRLIWSLKARHIKETYSIGYSFLMGPWKKYQKTFLINDIRNWIFLDKLSLISKKRTIHNDLQFRTNIFWYELLPITYLWSSELFKNQSVKRQLFTSSHSPS